METDDVLALGELADLARRRRGVGDEVYFVQNLYLNQTNVCRVKCKFCAFAKTEKQEGAYTFSPEDLVADAVAQRELTGFTEIHMVGGESPHVGFDYYVDIVRDLHEALPDVHLKLFTASEIHHMTTLSGLTHEEVLRELQAAGLGSLPGGGAEIFADRVRRLIAPGKEHPDIWFDTHRTAHGLGIPTHCTMLYGHVETYEERVDHLLRLRDQQDATGGFLAFVPLAFHPENTVFERRGFRFTTGAEDLLGRGDMLYQPSDLPRPIRLQGVFVSDQEIGRITGHWRDQIEGEPRYDLSIVTSDDESTGSVDALAEEEGDKLLPDAVSVIREYDRASASLLQRRLKIGYARAARIVDQLEARGALGTRLEESVRNGRVRLVTGFRVARVLEQGDALLDVTAVGDREDRDSGRSVLGAQAGDDLCDRGVGGGPGQDPAALPVSFSHLPAHENREELVFRLFLLKKNTS